MRLRECVNWRRKRSCLPNDFNGAGHVAKSASVVAGYVGMHGVRSTNYILQEADLLICSVRVLMTGRLAKPSSSARIQNYSCRYRPRRAG